MFIDSFSERIVSSFRSEMKVGAHFTPKGALEFMQANGAINISLLNGAMIILHNQA